MSKPQKPQDILVTNGWYLEIPVPGIMSDGLFETLEGIGQTSGVVETVDAGTNHKYKFSDQIVDFDEMTLTRPLQNNVTDKAMEALVTTMITTGLKLPVVAHKMHHGKEVFMIVFEGFSFYSQKHPTNDVAGTDKYVMTYTATCDGWESLPTTV